MKTILISMCVKDRFKFKLKSCCSHFLCILHIPKTKACTFQYHKKKPKQKPLKSWHSLRSSCIDDHHHQFAITIMFFYLYPCHATTCVCVFNSIICIGKKHIFLFDFILYFLKLHLHNTEHMQIDIYNIK